MATCIEKNRFNYPINIDVIVVDQKDSKDNKAVVKDDLDNQQHESVTGDSTSNNKKDNRGIKLLNAKLIDSNKKHSKIVGRYADLSV